MTDNYKLGKILFTESERMDKTWILIPFITTNIITVTVGLFSVIKAKEMTWIEFFIFFSLINIPLLALLIFTKFKVIIGTSGIAFQLQPFQIKKKTITWNEVSTASVVKYNPMRDYGGWGLKRGKKGLAYTISGSYGVYLEMKEGKNIMVGLKNHQAANEIITKIFGTNSDRTTIVNREKPL